MNKTFAQVNHEVKEAYADCWNTDFSKAVSRRNLSYRCSTGLRPLEWGEVMGGATLGSYNEFSAKKVVGKVKTLDILMFPAREGSVCIYISGPDMAKAAKALKGYADECSIKDGVLRVWWD